MGRSINGGRARQGKMSTLFILSLQIEDTTSTLVMDVVLDRLGGNLKLASCVLAGVDTLCPSPTHRHTTRVEETSSPPTRLESFP